MICSVCRMENSTEFKYLKNYILKSFLTIRLIFIRNITGTKNDGKNSCYKPILNGSVSNSVATLEPWNSKKLYQSLGLQELLFPFIFHCSISQLFCGQLDWCIRCIRCKCLVWLKKWSRGFPYITSAYFCTFSDPLTKYVSMNAVLNVNKN